MKQLENLKAIADRELGGLHAGQELKDRILLSAAQGKHAAKPHKQRIVIGCIGAAAVAAALLFAFFGVHVPGDTEPIIHSQPAGSMEPAGHDSMTIGNSGTVTTAGKQASSIWGDGIVAVGGRYYRELTTDASAAPGLAGASLGQVTEFLADVSLSAFGGIVSNSLPLGTTVYEIDGMGGTLVAASDAGVWHVYQRVSYSERALIGSERIQDTLQISGHIVAMSLSGAGAVSDPALCESLWQTLLNTAVYESSGTVSGRAVLLITLDNGLTVQLQTRNGRFGACGVWISTEFDEALREAMP